MQEYPQLIDWRVAVATGERLVPPGPAVSRADAHACVAELRRYAAQAAPIVADYTKLVAPTGRAAVVLDRPGWIRANVAGFATLLDPALRKLAERRGRGGPSRISAAVGSRIAGAEAGALLAFLAGKVLGQYEMFPPSAPGTISLATADDAPAGRLLLVAPNIVQAEQTMGVHPADFRLWVCLHEETHRLQFGAVPWLRGHVLGLIHDFVDETEVDASVLLRRVAAAAGAVRSAVRDSDEEGTSLMEALQTPRQRAIVARLTAVMSLLEGHAEFVMDGVGPQVVPTVADIRRRFQERRAGAGRLDVLLRRLLGLEAKMRQYRDGERFVRGVVERVGMDGFNAIWAGPDTLPLPEEIADPAAWVARVHPASLPA